MVDNGKQIQEAMTSSTCLMGIRCEHDAAKAFVAGRSGLFVACV
jgi:hypothetical protein